LPSSRKARSNRKQEIINPNIIDMNLQEDLTDEEIQMEKDVKNGLYGETF
jgi:hypothetical protein